MLVFKAKAAEPTSSLEHLLAALFSYTEHFVKPGCHPREGWPPLRWSGGRRAGSDRDRAPRYVHPGITSRLPNCTIVTGNYCFDRLDVPLQEQGTEGKPATTTVGTL
jgi:hypothetical protein